MRHISLKKSETSRSQLYENVYQISQFHVTENYIDYTKCVQLGLGFFQEYLHHLEKKISRSIIKLIWPFEILRNPVLITKIFCSTFQRYIGNNIILNHKCYQSELATWNANFVFITMHKHYNGLSRGLTQR